MWERVTEAAERRNQPGAFTAFIGDEWTSGPDGNNLHRNPIFRDVKELADQVVPVSAYDSAGPRGSLELGGRLRGTDRRQAARYPA
jgi:hypothetical protein